jgi:hypothetical protein
MYVTGGFKSNLDMYRKSTSSFMQRILSSGNLFIFADCYLISGLLHLVAKYLQICIKMYSY